MPFDFQPVLKGDLVLLRPLRPEDFDALYAVAADPFIWEQHPVSDRHERGRFETYFRDALASGGALIAIDAKTDQVIGASRFHGYDETASEVEIGWSFLARSHWGGQYNGQMKQLMLDHAFQFVENVVFLVGPRNLRSQRAVQKIGGVLVGSRANAEGRESYVYRITAARQREDVPMVMTVLEARVPTERLGDVERVFREGTTPLPPEIVETWLVRDTKDPALFRLTTIWRSMEDLKAMRASGVKPKGVQLFESVGAQPALSIFDVVVHRGHE